MISIRRRRDDRPAAAYTMPAEGSEHEGTWLTWPHGHTYGAEYAEELEGTWVQMAGILSHDENVHIMAYSGKDAERIYGMLEDSGAYMGGIDICTVRSDDLWVRDTGPMFVLDPDGDPAIAGFRFDGWGRKAPCRRDNRIPAEVSALKGIPYADVSRFVLEGGAVETDGRGTVMATVSSVVSDNRNRSISKEQAEEYMSGYLGARNFIWLNGVLDEDITDAHIDCIARFADSGTILTVSEKDLSSLYEDADPDDLLRLADAVDADGGSYRILEVPITADAVGDTGFHGSYLGYYVGNGSVLVPSYGDANDGPALRIISELHPGRKAVPIDSCALLKHGGAIHSITQQQPAGRSV